MARLSFNRGGGGLEYCCLPCQGIGLVRSYPGHMASDQSQGLLMLLLLVLLLGLALLVGEQLKCNPASSAATTGTEQSQRPAMKTGPLFGEHGPKQRCGEYAPYEPSVYAHHRRPAGSKKHAAAPN